MTNAGRVDDLGATGPRGTPSAADDGIGSRRELLGALRRIAVHLETAEVLELRADRSASPALATVLRERAEQRRRTAGRLRARLDGARRETIGGMAGGGRRPPPLPVTS